MHRDRLDHKSPPEFSQLHLTATAAALAEVRRVFETNFFGAARMIQAFVPAMQSVSTTEGGVKSVQIEGDDVARMRAHDHPGHVLKVGACRTLLPRSCSAASTSTASSQTSDELSGVRREAIRR